MQMPDEDQPDSGIYVATFNKPVQLELISYTAQNALAGTVQSTHTYLGSGTTISVDLAALIEQLSAYTPDPSRPWLNNDSAYFALHVMDDPTVMLIGNPPPSPVHLLIG